MASDNLPAGSYVVDLNQPQRLLIKSILEPDTPQDKAFVDDNMARFQRNQMRGKGQPKEEYGFYDITAWSLPLVFGVDAWWTEDVGDVAGSMVDAAYIENAKRGSVTGRAAISYVIPYETDSTGAMVMPPPSERFQGRRRNAPSECRRAQLECRYVCYTSFAKSRVGTRDRPSIRARDGRARDGGQFRLLRRGRHQRRRRGGAVAEGTEDRDRGGRSGYAGIVRFDMVTFDKHGVKFTPMTIANIRGGGLKNYNVLILPEGRPAVI